jgi:peroxiredoxin
MRTFWSDLRFAAGLARREFQLGVRGPAFWGLSAVGALYALWRATAADTTTALACYQVVQAVLIGLGVVAVLFGGGAASRDLQDRSLELVLAKPAGTRPLLVFSRFLGLWFSLLAIVIIALVAVFLGQLISGGTPWRFAIYGHALARCLVPLGLAAAVGFALTTIFASPLAAALAAVYWVAVPLAREHLPSVFDVTVAQHWPMGACFAAALIAFSSHQHGRSIVTGARRGLARFTAALFAGGVYLAIALNSAGTDALTEPDPVLSAISHQTAERGTRAPGFWLPEADGRLVGLDDYAGRRVLFAFWGPTDPASVPVIGAVKTLAASYRDRLTCVVVCVDRDSATLSPFAREAGPEVIMLWDRGTHFAPGQPWLSSPAATAYAVEQVPSIFLLDRDRTIVQGPVSAEPGVLEAAVARFVGER